MTQESYNIHLRNGSFILTDEFGYGYTPSSLQKSFKINRLDIVSGEPLPKPEKGTWLSGVDVLETRFFGPEEDFETHVKAAHGRGSGVIRIHTTARRAEAFPR